MIDDFNQSIKEYWAKWQELVAQRNNKNFFEDLKPTAACWKVDNLADHDRRINELRDHADHIHSAWLNGRWLTTVYLREPLEQEIKIAKVYQKRPNSSDPSGLDHLDFYAQQIDEAILSTEPDLKWSHESNNEFCKWISIWFNKTEAKLRTGTTLDVCAAELTHASKEIKND